MFMLVLFSFACVFSDASFRRHVKAAAGAHLLDRETNQEPSKDFSALLAAGLALKVSRPDYQETQTLFIKYSISTVRQKQHSSYVLETHFCCAETEADSVCSAEACG